MQHGIVKIIGNRGGSSNNNGSSSRGSDSGKQLRQTPIRLYTWLGVLGRGEGFAEKYGLLDPTESFVGKVDMNLLVLVLGQSGRA
jgi:hypothetical protein